jgi:hypothetical protein
MIALNGTLYELGVRLVSGQHGMELFKNNRCSLFQLIGLLV